MEVEVRKIEGEKLLLFGGVYSNYAALLALKSWADEHGYTSQNTVCTGDVIAYCAEANQCADLVDDWAIHCIAGNVEIQLRNREDHCGCNFDENSSCDIHSQRWYPYAQNQVTKKNLQWMEDLPEHLVLDFCGERWGVTHGSVSKTSRFVYKSSPWEDKQLEFDLLGVKRMLVGHCGVPFVDQKEEYSWINSGALGIPANDGTSEVWFATIERVREEFKLAFHRLEYDWKSTQDAMKAANLPEVYIKTLETGLWDSTETLRPEEVAQTGIRLHWDKKPYYLKALQTFAD